MIEVTETIDGMRFEKDTESGKVFLIDTKRGLKIGGAGSGKTRFFTKPNLMNTDDEPEEMKSAKKKQ